MNHRPRHNLALHLLAFYLLFIVPILAAALFFDAQASRRLQADVGAADLSLAEAIALETDALLLKARQAVEAFARMPAVVEMDLPGMEEAFATGAAARQDINLFYRLDANGVMVFHYPVGPGSTVGVDFSFRDYFQAARSSPGAVFSKGRISPTTGRPVATVVMPIRDAEGRFDGVVATNLELQRLTQTLVVIGQDPAQGVQVAIVDAVGQIIAHSRPEEYLLTNAYDALPGVPQVLAGQQGNLIARDQEGREWLYSYAPIPTAGWGVIVQRPTEIAFATSRAFHRGLLLAIALIILGAALFWWALLRRVIRPLEDLTRFSRLGGQPGEAAAEERAALDRLAARRDQVGDLARTLLRRLTELETLLETSTAVVSSLDSQQVLDNILEQVQRLLRVDTCAVLVQDEASGQLTVRASRGLSERYVRELCLDASTRQLPAWRAIDSGQPIQVPDVEADPALTEILPLVRAEGYRALLDVPLITPHGPPAVLVIYRADPHHFSAEEVNLAVTFANQAAMALENAVLFSRTDEELQKQVRSLGALNRALHKVSQSLLLDDVLTNALDAVVQVVGADAAWVSLLREGETTLRLRAQRGLSPRLTQAVGELEIDPEQEDWESRLLGDFEAHAAAEGLHPLAAVPLRAKETMVGVLGAAMRSERDRRFSAFEMDLLSAIGSQVGIAVENARLYRRSRQAAVLEERNRLAREIHDALAQGLTGIIVQLEAMERLAQRRPEQALASLQRAKDLARHSLREARRSVWGLRPRSLEEMTLTEALRARVEALNDDGRLRATFAVSGSRRILSPDVELNLFRIAQEALVNVQRHAQAQAVHVRLDFGQAHMRLIVEDDGVGLPAGIERENRGFGLTSMRERTALLGGQMTIHSRPGEGTRIEVIVPG
ncbi:MAG TPA: GAF domain-containing protein [Anaerolineae bacterium]|nr:GAF domain-containing protein [Anaerolineae bacterium]